MLDTLIRGAKIIDGTGKAAFNRRERHAAVAVHKRREALAELRLAKVFAKQRRVGVAVDVDRWSALWPTGRWASVWAWATRRSASTPRRS